MKNNEDVPSRADLTYLARDPRQLHSMRVIADHLKEVGVSLNFGGPCNTLIIVFEDESILLDEEDVWVSSDATSDNLWDASSKDSASDFAIKAGCSLDQARHYQEQRSAAQKSERITSRLRTIGNDGPQYWQPNAGSNGWQTGWSQYYPTPDQEQVTQGTQTSFWSRIKSFFSRLVQVT